MQFIVPFLFHSKKKLFKFKGYYYDAETGLYYLFTKHIKVLIRIKIMRLHGVEEGRAVWYHVLSYTEVRERQGAKPGLFK